MTEAWQAKQDGTLEKGEDPVKVFRMYLTSSKISSELLDCMLPRHTDID